MVRTLYGFQKHGFEQFDTLTAHTHSLRQQNQFRTLFVSSTGSFIRIENQMVQTKRAREKASVCERERGTKKIQFSTLKLVMWKFFQFQVQSSSFFQHAKHTDTHTSTISCIHTLNSQLQQHIVASQLFYIFSSNSEQFLLILILLFYFSLHKYAHFYDFPILVRLIAAPQLVCVHAKSLMVLYSHQNYDVCAFKSVRQIYRSCWPFVFVLAGWARSVHCLVHVMHSWDSYKCYC